MLNRRFVSFYFDLSTRGFAGDSEARKFVVAALPRLGGRGVPTPPFLFMNGKGKILGTAGPYDSPDRVYKALLQVMQKHPEYNRLSSQEKQLPPLAKARLYFDLGQFDKSQSLLQKQSGSQAHYLLGRLARFRRDWKAMEQHLVQVKDTKLKNDVRMERAFPYWFAKQFKNLRIHLHNFPKKSHRYTEARYYEGLAQHLLGEKKKALAVWSSTIKSCSQDPWIYRADWAYANVLDGKRRFFSTAGKRSSLLNRIGYMGRRNPDLQGP